MELAVSLECHLLAHVAPTQAFASIPAQTLELAGVLNGARRVIPTVSISLEARYEKDPSIVYREIAGEAILVPIRRHLADLDSVYALDEVGSRTWELLEGGRSLENVCSELVAEYDVAWDVLAADVVEFVQQLETFGAVRRLAE
jgi:hypothetical protein